VTGGDVRSQLSSGNMGSLLNRFDYAYNTQNNQLGGLSSLYQSGGPRSLQLALTVSFQLPSLSLSKAAT